MDWFFLIACGLAFAAGWYCNGHKSALEADGKAELSKIEADAKSAFGRATTIRT